MLKVSEDWKPAFSHFRFDFRQNPLHSRLILHGLVIELHTGVHHNCHRLPCRPRCVRLRLPLCLHRFLVRRRSEVAPFAFVCGFSIGQEHPRGEREFVFFVSSWITCARHANSDGGSAPRRGSTRQEMKKNRSDTTRRRRRDMAAIIDPVPSDTNMISRAPNPDAGPPESAAQRAPRRYATYRLRVAPAPLR